MSPLPAGTLTLLFSDIEGSTSLLNRLGSRWGEALSAHRGILRGAFEAHGGQEMGTEGDSFFVVFTSAHEAVAAAIEAQAGSAAARLARGRPLRVRIGMHTGEPRSTRTTTSGSTSTGRPGSRRPPMAVRSSSPATTRSWSGGPRRRTTSCGTSAGTASRTSPSRSTCSRSTPRASRRAPAAPQPRHGGEPADVRHGAGRTGCAELAEICDLIDRGSSAGDADRHRGDREDPAGRRGGERAGAPARAGTFLRAPCTPRPSRPHVVRDR